MGLGRREAGEYNAYSTQAVHAAATATEQRALFTAPCKGRVRGVRYTPDVASTGDNANTTHLNLVNKGATGVGTTQVGTLQLLTGVNLVAFDEKDIPLTGAFTVGVDLAQGDVLAVEYQKVGTGVLVGPGTFVIDWEPL